jgi:hypothetical protein
MEPAHKLGNGRWKELFTTRTKALFAVDATAGDATGWPREMSPSWEQAKTECEAGGT